jgi:hypothetical protein
MGGYIEKWMTNYTVKKISGFPVPDRDVTYQHSLAGNNLINTDLGELVIDIPAGDRDKYS